MASEIAENIIGINEKTVKKLEEVGISSLEDIREMNLREVSEHTRIGRSILRRYKAMADLLTIKHITPQIAKLLVDAGIYSRKDLANVSKEELKRFLLDAYQKGKFKL
jgi:predicted flap endonuclease-1-like 5' DNA nuclease